jgi:serine/threonine-protein kinase
MSETELKQLGRYRLLAELGRGAMGVVYRAEDPLLNRTVAIKTIIMTDDPAGRADYEARFLQEAKAAGGLNHPNLITIHDVGREGGVAYMAMELLEGTELRELIARGRLPLRFAIDVLAQVADGLAHAHEHGVVHRDIKPGNIMVVRGQLAKIMDFGIARVRASDVKTQTGAILGSPRYISPEQVTGQPVDRRCDIFSLGVVLHELAAGEPPFSAPTVTQLLHQIATAAPRPPSATNPAVPAMLDLIVARALEKQPDARYQSAAELAADLRACLGELGGPAAAQSASGMETMRPAAAATPAARFDVQLDAASSSVARAAVTAELFAATGSDFGTHLPLSRKFDSAEALRVLARPAPGGGMDGIEAQAASEPGRSSALARLWNPARLVFLLAILAASAAAYYIAYYY